MRTFASAPERSIGTPNVDRETLPATTHIDASGREVAKLEPSDSHTERALRTSILPAKATARLRHHTGAR